MKRNFFGLFIFLLFSTISFAQDTSNTEPEKSPSAGITYPPIFAAILLPEQENSWSVNIYIEGGIVGSSDLVVALNSNGKYQCGEEGSVNSIPLTNKSFLEVAQAVKTIQTSFYSKNITTDADSCNDCLYSSLSFYRHSQKDKEQKPQPQTDLPNVKDIYQKVLKAVDCNQQAE